MINLSTNLSALNAFATGTYGTAYNIANVNTAGFQPVDVRYRSGRPSDQGVQAVVARPASDASPVNAAYGPMPISHVDVTREMTNLIINQRSFEANAAVIRTEDALLGTILDLKV